MIDELKKLSGITEEKSESKDEFFGSLAKHTFEKKTISNNKFHKIFLKNFYTIMIFVFFFSSYLLFFLSLEKCNLGIGDCSRKVMWIITKIIELVISCVIMSILIELCFIISNNFIIFYTFKFIHMYNEK